MDFSYNNVENLVCALCERNTSLGHLTLSEATLPQRAIDALCKMQSLKELFILDSFQISEINILKISLSLRNLETISIMNNEISVDTLLNIVIGATNLIRAEFKIFAGMRLGNDEYESIYMRIGNRKKLQLCVHKEGNFAAFKSELHLLNMGEKPNLTISRIYSAYKSVLANITF